MLDPRCLACPGFNCYGGSTFCVLRRSPISSTIFIGNLSFEATEDELRTLLVEVDPRVRVRLGMDRMTGKPRGFAFAEFSDAAMAADAIRRFDSVDLRGRRLRVNDADDKPPPRAPRPGGPGPGGPRFGAGAPSSPGGGYRPSAPSAYGGAGDFPPPDFGGGGGFPPFKKNGGSRRGLRGKKRSLR